MANFCGKCGSPVDQNTGLCPVCDKAKAVPVAQQNVASDYQNQPASGSTQKFSLINDTAGNGTLKNENAYPAPVAQTVPEKKSKQKSGGSKGVSALCITITVLLTVCLFFTSVLAFAVYGTRNAVKKDNLEKISDDISYTETFNAFAGESNSLGRFYNYVDDNFDVTINDGDVDRIIKKTSISRFIVGKLSKFIEDFFDGNGKIVIEKDNIRDQLYKNSNYIRKQTGLDLDTYYYPNYDKGRVSQSDRDTVGNAIADWIINDEKVTVLNDSTFKDKYPALYYILKFGFSYINLAILAVIIALILFGLIKNSYSQGLISAGVVFIILGFAFSSAGLLSMMGSVWESITGGSVIGTLIGKLFEINILPSVLILVTGILLIVIRFLVRLLISKRKAKINNA